MAVNWKRFILILATGGATGLLWNATSGRGFALGRSVLIQAGDVLVQAMDAKSLLDGGALFLDARPRDLWQASRIPGAISFPEEAFDSALVEIEPVLRNADRMVVYCSGSDCESSHIVARKLNARSFNASILEGGIPAWEDAGFLMDWEPRP